MHIVYAPEEPPSSWTKSLFLAGPTPRDKSVPSWRPEALRLLEEASYDGVVFVPENRGGTVKVDYTGEVEWEELCLNLADVVLFWVPREMKTMPALTTNIEWGVWHDSGKAVLGAPPDAKHVRYLRYYAEKMHIPTAETLPETIGLALTVLGDGAMRLGGEREVPLSIWRTKHFQDWYRMVIRAGNRLDSARVKWVFHVGSDKEMAFLFALQVSIYIAAEQRHKSNEVIISRPDVSAILLYLPQLPIGQTKLLLVREFRSPVANIEGYVRELPSGSSLSARHTPDEVAIKECEEETGLVISSDRLRYQGTRQIASTLSAHRAHLFSAELTPEEYRTIIGREKQTGAAEDDAEHTHVEIQTLEMAIHDPSVDWSMLGMILSAIR
ncbi:MAG: hypothetical protein A3B31_02870 [Candidatus Komeilibacteria bacterium RIFCSPLOWO2_01_FULL_53_11]|uniref:Nudix hydrolase domain-containing protein n=1 Tax=Candidatus Komeilibacteria bacterium RIFCSPLOWO2_01_FULL_53_11 TaxID=1798552 RepID=A0A1G2BUG9_9BACT|nr:MAG: hypothetical protein A3B31_02870 [Candidatus Komeilibacteria bacterium RIFCSPLOWO2_01_FULL_53_11]